MEKNQSEAKRRKRDDTLSGHHSSTLKPERFSHVNDFGPQSSTDVVCKEGHHILSASDNSIEKKLLVSFSVPKDLTGWKLAVVMSVIICGGIYRV